MQIRHLFEKFFGTEIRHTVVTCKYILREKCNRSMEPDLY